MALGHSERKMWRALQGIKLGSDQTPLEVHLDAQEKFEKDHRLCLVVKPLNPKYQPAAEIKNTLPTAWGLRGKVEGQANDDGSVNFYFNNEHHMLMVIENAPYTVGGWLLVMDKWVDRCDPTYLTKIPMHIRIINLPNKYRRYELVKSIGSWFGRVDDVQILEPTAIKPGQVGVKVDFNIDKEIILTRMVRVLRGDPPVELNFRYLTLEKFCTTCGSLKHDANDCSRKLTKEELGQQLIEIFEASEEAGQKIDAAGISSLLGYTPTSIGTNIASSSKGGASRVVGEKKKSENEAGDAGKSIPLPITKSVKRKELEGIVIGTNIRVDGEKIKKENDAGDEGKLTPLRITRSAKRKALEGKVMREIPSSKQRVVEKQQGKANGQEETPLSTSR